MNISTATLQNGQTIQYLETADPVEGGMKTVYFTPDKCFAIAFFKDSKASDDPNRLRRLEAVLGKYNPTKQENGKYWQTLFCWPTAIVIKPWLGVVVPHYLTLPGNYFFASGPNKGREKKGRWFTSEKHRNKMLAKAPGELGDWKNYLSICILIARAVRRLNVAGLAHSDLSDNNILIDPTSGRCVVIDIDSLVVEDLFPPDVIGTKGFIAPEVLRTQNLPLKDPNRKHPNVRTDLHALPVLLYQYLFFRHPLNGPKSYPGADGNEQELLEMGSKALFIEHPQDHSNRPYNLIGIVDDLGPKIKELFEKAFVRGIENPFDRPSAGQWEKVLMKAWDCLHPCKNLKCWHKWFIIHGPNIKQCPNCQSKLSAPVPVLKLLKQTKNGLVDDGLLVVFDGKELFGYHAFDNRLPGESADRTPLGHFKFNKGKWYLVNDNLTSLISPNGTPVAPRKNLGIELQSGIKFTLANEPNGRVAEVVYFGS